MVNTFTIRVLFSLGRPPVWYTNARVQADADCGPAPKADYMSSEAWGCNQQNTWGPSGITLAFRVRPTAEAP